MHEPRDRTEAWLREEQKRKEELDELKNEIAKLKAAVSPSEAIFAFAGWLTSRPVVLPVGSTADAALMADLVKQFVDANGWAEPREGWTGNISIPQNQGAEPPEPAPAATE